VLHKERAFLDQATRDSDQHDGETDPYVSSKELMRPEQTAVAKLNEMVGTGVGCVPARSDAACTDARDRHRRSGHDAV
jgi:hypothetical protein